MSERGILGEPDRRRRRLRYPPAATNTPRLGRSALTADVPDPQPPSGRPRGSDAPPEDRETERGLRGLIGAGASQLSTSAALRARDAARPTDADLAEAEERLVLVRRNWVPRESQR